MSKINETLDAMRAARANPSEEITRAFSVSTGLIGYDLEAPAKTLYPFFEWLTPLRNRIPRVKGNGSNAVNWKAVTGINTTNVHPGVSEGQRGAVITTTTSSHTAPYVTLGLEDSVTFEADESAQGFDDAKARATLGLLRSMILQEERMLLGGNGHMDLGITPDPTVAGVASGGTIADGTYNVGVVALTMEGYKRASVGATGVVQSISKTNADGSSDTIYGFAAQPCANLVTTGALAGGNDNSVTAIVTPVRGAFGYAWYFGAAGAEKIVAVTILNSVVITAAAAGGNQAWSALEVADRSKEADQSLTGMFYHALKADSGAYFKALATGVAGAGTKLTANGRRGITEIDEALAAIWDAWAFEPDEILCHRREAEDISKLILGSTTGPTYQLQMGGNQASVAAGGRITTYVSPISGKEIPIRIHRDAIPGAMLLNTFELPFKVSGVDNIVQMKLLREYYQLEWPLRTRKYEYGVYVRGLVQHYAPFSLGVLCNIAAQ